MSAKYSVIENKNPLNVFESFRTNIGEKSVIEEEFHHSPMIKITKVLFRFDNNRRAMLHNPWFERI
jgi:tRNA(Glu) U13 pseudouridine synthase TruD